MERKKKVTVKDEDVGETQGAEAAHWADKAADSFAPFGHKCLGMAAVYFYEDELNMSRTEVKHSIATQVRLGGIPEEFADMGYKKLLDKMMGVYGRKPKRGRS